MTPYIVDSSVVIKWFVPELWAADEKLVNSLAATQWAASLLRVQDVP